MEVSCPVWPPGPWSPVGYQVVEVADKQNPGRESAQVPVVPRAAAGYRVVVEPAVGEVAEEASPEPTPCPPPAARAAAPRNGRRLARWGAAVGGGSILLAAMVALVVLRLPTRVVAATAVIPGGESGLQCAPATAGGGCVDRQVFGTAVSFVRNPTEAGRIAAREQKLTFLLHVSGSFEDEGLT